MLAIDLIRLARPRNWIKNVIVFFPLVFAGHLFSAEAWQGASLAAVAFCLLASACYVLNDIQDRAKDRLHPTKKNRPLAAGTVSVPVAGVWAVILGAGAFGLAAFNSKPLLVVLALYLALQVTYSFAFKKRILLDVICIAIGFVLRAAAGAAAITAPASPWLVICTFTLCLFMGFCKRSNEIATLGNNEKAQEHRATLGAYTTELLTHLITLSAAISVMAFLMWAANPATHINQGGIGLVFTLPMMIYGIFRFAMLSMKGVYADPTELIFKDRPFQLAVMLWVAAVMLIGVLGPLDLNMQSWPHPHVHLEQ